MAVGFPENGFYYNEQLKSYILQFMAIFTGLSVKVGKSQTEDERLISVPIFYGAMDRVVAALLQENTQNKPIRLPCMSVYASGLDLATDMMHGTGVERRNVFIPSGGLVPDDARVVHQLMPVPYRLTMDLTIYVSNTDHHFQILEQILLLFNPSLQIQTSDSLFDWTRLSTVELKSIDFEQNYPPSSDRRIIQTTLRFETVIRISAPAEVRKDFVEKIFMRIGAVSLASKNNFDIIAELDDQNVEYEQIWGIKDTLPFK